MFWILQFWLFCNSGLISHNYELCNYEGFFSQNCKKILRIISEMQVLNLELRGINAHLQNKSELWEINLQLQETFLNLDKNVRIARCKFRNVRCRLWFTRRKSEFSVYKSQIWLFPQLCITVYLTFLSLYLTSTFFWIWRNIACLMPFTDNM